MKPLVAHWDDIFAAFFGPLRLKPLFLHPFSLAGFGFKALRSARGFAESHFREQQARALFGGMCGHWMLPLERPVSAAAGLALGTMGHAIGWPLPRGGSQCIVDAMAAYLRALGGEIVTGTEDQIARYASARPRRAVRHHPSPVAAHSRYAPAIQLPAQVATLPLRPRRLQARPGAGWPHSLAKRQPANAPEPSTWAARCPKSPPPKQPCGAANIPNGPW